MCCALQETQIDGVGGKQSPVCWYCATSSDFISSLRKHILEDLRPYLCTYPDCETAYRLYGSRSDWLAHEEAIHRQAWRCRDHPKDQFTKQADFRSHLKLIHQDLNDEQIEAFVEFSVSALEDSRDQCKICLKYTSDLPKKQALFKHIANHYETFATFSAPRNADLDVEDSDRGSIIPMQATDSVASDLDSLSDWSDHDAAMTGSDHLASLDNIREHNSDKLDILETFWKSSFRDESSDETVEQSTLHRNVAFGKKGFESENTLNAACSIGDISTVQVLLDQGADVNASGGIYGNALKAASEGGHETVVQVLLDQGADVNASGGIYGNALKIASEGGHETVVQLLLDRGADVNASGGIYGNALEAASEGGHEMVVQLLLDWGADVNASGGRDGNALEAASRGGHETVVQLLLDRGVDVNASGGIYRNALEAASEGGHEKVVQLLLDWGADVNASGGRDGNALEAASRGGHETVVQLLLDWGADVNASGGRYGNALQAASEGGHETVVQLLLDWGADVNASGGRYRNALQAASERGHEKVVQLLLDQGANGKH